MVEPLRPKLQRQNSEGRVPGAVYALSAAALFGASTPAAKLLLRELSPLMLSALLYLGAAIALSVYRFIPGFEPREAQITRRDLPPICGVIFFGGIAGPILMFFGLQRLSALTGSLLLNLEGPFTALIAVGLLREHLGKRELLAAAAIMLGGVLVGFQPGHVGGSWIGTLEITVACLSWGIDNNLTQRVSLRDPVAVARIKTLAALVRARHRALAGKRGNSRSDEPGMRGRRGSALLWSQHRSRREGAPRTWCGSGSRIFCHRSVCRRAPVNRRVSRISQPVGSHRRNAHDQWSVCPAIGEARSSPRARGHLP